MSNMNSSSDNTSEQLAMNAEYARRIYAVIIPILCLLCFAAFVVNVPVLMAFYSVSRKGRFSATLRLTLSLALTDEVTSLMMLISLINNSLLPVVYGIKTENCVPLIVETARNGCFVAGIWHILVLSFNHFVSISFPFRYQQILNRRVTNTLILLLWLCPLLHFLAWATVFPDHGYRSHKCQKADQFAKLPFRLTISLMIFGVFVSVCILYGLMLVKLRRLRFKFENRAPKEDQFGQKAKRRVSSMRNLLRLQRERRTMITSIIICGTFFVGWMPASVHIVLTCADCMFSGTKALQSFERMVTVTSISALTQTLILLKSLVNPMIYALRIPEVKRELCCATWQTASVTRQQRRQSELSTLRANFRHSGKEKHSNGEDPLENRLLEERHEEENEC